MRLSSLYIPVAMAELGDIEETKVSDHHLAVLHEDVFGLQVLVDNVPSVEISHAL